MTLHRQNGDRAQAAIIISRRGVSPRETIYRINTQNCFKRESSFAKETIHICSLAINSNAIVNVSPLSSLISVTTFSQKAKRYYYSFLFVPNCSPRFSNISESEGSPPP